MFAQFGCAGSRCFAPPSRVVDQRSFHLSSLRLRPRAVTIPDFGAPRAPRKRTDISGYDCEQVKACCIAAGLPVIDSRLVAFEDVVRLAVRGPMAAVGEEASPPPYHAAGAEVFKISVPAGPATPQE